MKKITGMMCMVTIASLTMMFAGCGKKAEEKAGVDPQAQQMLVQGTVFLKQGEVVKAVQSFATAIKTSPDYFEPYYMLGETFIHLKQFPQAQSVLTAAVNRFPDNPVGFYLLAISYEGSGNMMPAIMAARKSVDLFQGKQDEDGRKRATILLGALVQVAKQQAEANALDGAVKDAAQAVADTMPAIVPADASAVMPADMK